MLRLRLGIGPTGDETMAWRIERTGEHEILLPGKEKAVWRM